MTEFITGYPDQQEEVPAKRGDRHNYFVAVYLADRAYGGPEEGGWWYDCGELVRVVRLFRTEESACEYARRLNRKLRSRRVGPNVGRREKWSMASDGEYEAHAYTDFAPQCFPDRRPHYE